MIRNYWKVALRYLAKHRGYSFINILGLAVGIASCILIMLFVKSEWSFDRFHQKSDRIYRAWLEEHYEGQVFTNTVTPVPLAPVLQAGIPELESTCRVFAFNTQVKSGNQSFNDPVNMVDSSFFRLFDFPLVEGSLKDPFPNSRSVILTEEAAKKYFGKEPSLGKNLELQLGADKVLFTVAGIARNIPYHSSIQFDLLIPFSNAPYIFSESVRTKAWSNVSLESYVLLKKDARIEEAQAKIPSIMNPLVAKNYKPGEYIVSLQPLTDIHLNNKLPAGNQSVSDPKYAYILACVGVLILLIACINFVTLSIGRSTTRALEVGVRKVLGADRSQLLRQFWGEALFLTIIALLTGIALAALLLNSFNQLANRDLILQPDVFTILFCLSLVMVIGLLAGIYPALVLSGFKPIQVLKGRLKTGNMGLFRKGLIVGQFMASIVMIIGTWTVGNQLNYLRSKDLGYDKEHLVVVSTNLSRREGVPLAKRLQTSLGNNPEVINTTISLFSMAESGWMNLGYMDNKDAFRQFRFNVIDANFVETTGLKMISGRSFSKTNTADSNYILVNEALVKEYGWKEPLGQQLPGKYQQQVIGVVRDFHFESLHTPIKPAVLALKPDSIFAASSDVSYAFPPQPRLTVRFRGGNLQKHIEDLRIAWKSVAGNQDFNYQFLDDALNSAYQQEERLGKIVRYASFLSIFIACMGLFGLATLMVVRRTKEIGIRKVLGADTGKIVYLLSKDFILLIVVAALVAFPLAWLGLQQWLQDFAYRVNISPWPFVGAALLALLVAIATISIQAIKAAWMNPVESLRTE